MDKLVWFLIVFIIVYLFYFFFVICRKKKLEQFKTSTEMLFLQRKFKIDLSKHNIKMVAHMVALINAFIIAITFVILEIFDNIFIKIMVIYSIFGKQLKKKEGKENV